MSGRTGGTGGDGILDVVFEAIFRREDAGIPPVRRCCLTRDFVFCETSTSNSPGTAAPPASGDSAADHQKIREMMRDTLWVERHEVGCIVNQNAASALRRRKRRRLEEGQFFFFNFAAR